MYEVLKEIRDFIRAGMVDSAVAGVGTTTTTLILATHGLNTGDIIINTSRGNARRVVTVVDANTLTVDAVAAQASGDAITIPLFKKCYVGKVANPATNYMPMLCIYGNETRLTAKSTATDKSEFSITIEVCVSALSMVSEQEYADDIMPMQKYLQDIMEARDTNGVATAKSVWGQLRRHMMGVTYLFNNELSVRYDFSADAGRPYHKATMTLAAAARFAQRS